MKHKNIVATIYLKNGEAVKSPSDLSSAGDLKELTKLYNDSGIDKKLTGVLNEMRADGTIQSIAEKYGVDVSMAVWGNQWKIRVEYGAYQMLKHF